MMRLRWTVENMPGDVQRHKLLLQGLTVGYVLCSEEGRAVSGVCHVDGSQRVFCKSVNDAKAHIQTEVMRWVHGLSPGEVRVDLPPEDHPDLFAEPRHA